MYFRNLLSRTAALVLWATLVTACGGGGGGGGPAPAAIVAPLQNNVLAITVDSGPTGTGYNVNRLYTTVTVCKPGSTQCQTIDHVLVDTGSTGLRLLASVMAPGFNLTPLAASSGSTLLNCVQFVDNSFAWGPVVTADIVLGSKTAASVSIQVIADPAFGSPAAACSVGGTAITTAAILGANGILGLGLFKEDCGSGCTFVTNNGYYYTCTNVGCTTTTATRASIAQQVKNPVPLFSADNNGMLIDLPAANLAGAASLSGSLIFGIGTQANNQLASASVLTTSASGYITTLLGAQTLVNSFLDTGSNGLFFDSVSIPACSGVGAAIGFYCPNVSTTLSASLVGVNAVSSSTFSFSIGNATALLASGPNHVFPTLAGNIGRATTFDWGLPFFYGRRVFVGIEGLTPALATGAFYAF